MWWWSIFLFFNVTAMKFRIIILLTDQPKIILPTTQKITTKKISCLCLTTERIIYQSMIYNIMLFRHRQFGKTVIIISTSAAKYIVKLTKMDSFDIKIKA